MKQPTKVNPYEKKKVTKKRITRKQWTIGGILLAVAAVIVFLVVFGPKNNQQLDEHAGHNHAAGEDCNATVDPHAGHNHAAGEDCNVTTDPHAGHNHAAGEGSDHNEESETGVLNYRVYTNADKTYRVAVVNTKNEVLFEQDKLYNAPVKEDVSEEIFTLGWATGNGANDFAHVFCNKKTGAVSQEFVAPRGYDGVRVAYPNKDQTKIVVQDIFNKDTYYKEYALADAFRKDGDIVAGGKLQSDKKSVIVSYFTDEEGTIRQTVIHLYE